MNSKVIMLFLMMTGFHAFGEGNTVNVLLKMLPAQETYFQENVLKSFEAEHSCKVKVHNFTDNWKLAEILREKENSIDVVKVPMSQAHLLAEKGLVKPLRSIIGDKGLEGLKKQYFLMVLAEVNGSVYYIPRKFETRIMVYMKSRVLEAVENWNKFRKEIEAALKKNTGNGLPGGYTLEENPSQWDYFDILTAGYYWKKMNSGDGRVAHRGKTYSGTSIGLMDRCFQMGAEISSITNSSSKYYTNVLEWESLYSALNIYNKASWEDGWSGKDIWKAFKSGDVYLSFLTQIDCYALHGSTGIKFLEDSGDFGTALMPKAVSLSGRKSGKRTSSTGGWLWGVGAGSADAKLAVKLIAHITNYKNQIGETEQFGMIPVTKKILGQSTLGFSEPWKNDVFKTSLRQLKQNGSASLPYTGDFRELEMKYIKIWKEVITSGKYMPPEEIEKIQLKYGKK